MNKCMYLTLIMHNLSRWLCVILLYFHIVCSILLMPHNLLLKSVLKTIAYNRKKYHDLCCHELFLIVPGTQVQNSLRGIPRSETFGLYCMQTLRLSR